MTARRRAEVSPALIASALAHVAFLAAVMIAWPWFAKPLKLGKVVDVTLITSGPAAELAQALKAETVAPAATETPTPEAPPEPAPLTAETPTQPTPAPAVAAKPKPAPTKAKAKQDLDLDALLATVSKTQSASNQPSSGRRGAPSARTDLAAREGKGEDDRMSASEIDALRSKLEKLWNPNCQVEGAAGVNVKVLMRLTPQGWLAAKPELRDKSQVEASGDAILIASAQRALSAVGAGAPYTELNPRHYSTWRELIVTFNAKEACAGR
jgi:outer membrane biosynthesis protein TonB